MGANVKRVDVRRNIVNAFRWEFYAIPLFVVAIIVKILKKNWRIEWIMTHSYRNLKILKNTFYEFNQS